VTFFELSGRLKLPVDTSPTESFSKFAFGGFQLFLMIYSSLAYSIVVHIV